MDGMDDCEQMTHSLSANNSRLVLEFDALVNQ